MNDSENNKEKESKKTNEDSKMNDKLKDLLDKRLDKNIGINKTEKMFDDLPPEKKELLDKLKLRQEKRNIKK